MLLIALELFKQRWRVISITAGTIIAASIAAAVFMTPVYRGETIITYVASDQSATGLSALAGRLTSLPLLGGMGLGETGDVRSEALATLQSRQFTVPFIEKHGLMPMMFPGQWDAQAKRFKPRRWTFKRNDVPDLADGYRRFNEDLREIGDDKTTGLIHVSILSRDRLRVAGWTNDLVREADDLLRARALRESRASVQFLERELQRTTQMETRQVIFQVMESELGKAAMANSKDFYAFRVIDPAVTSEPDEQVRPQRALLVVLGLFFGIFLGFALALAQNSLQSAK